MDQSLYLLNSQEIQDKLASTGSRAAQLAGDSRDNGPKIRELYLLFYARPPTDAELANIRAYVARKPDNRREAYEDVLWALLNSKEFLFNH